MAEVTVKLNHLRQAPRKVRLVIDVIRGAATARALEQLGVMPKRAALPVSKLLTSGIAAAKAHGLSDSNLWISQVRADQGPALKRRMINSRGRASMIKKFTSHITLTLSDTPTRSRKGRS